MSQNPYEAPRYDTTLGSPTYYQLLSTKLNLREYRRISKNWFELLLGVCLKFLRIRLPSTFAFATSGDKGDLDPPPHILGESHPGMAMPELLQRHLSRLSSVDSSVVTIHDSDELELLLRGHEQKTFAYSVQRGVYVPVSNGEVARLKRLELATPDAPRPTANPQFHWIEMICWIGLAMSLFLFARGEPANVAQAVFRLSILLASGAGIAIVWLIRGVAWTQHKVVEE